MDLASIGLSAVLSALLFVVLEFTIILPLFRKIVTKSVGDMVQGSLIPSISAYIDSQIDDLVTTLTKSLFSKFRAYLGGTKKGVNAIMQRLAAGEDLEDIQEEYEPSTVDKVVDILYNASQYLPSIKGANNNGKEKEILNKDEDSLQDSAQEAPFKQAQFSERFG